ncbi:MAG: hypothetical protein WC637_23215 [Victivallales bacterium]|jgi:hypothetical protein
MFFNRKKEEEEDEDDFGRTLNPVPGLKELLERDKIDPLKLSIAFQAGDDDNIIIEDRTDIILIEMKKARHIEWKVDSLRALFRGTKNPPPEHEMAKYPDEYVGFFYGIERYVHTACSIKTPYPFDEQFIEVYSLMRRRPDSKSTGLLHDVVWQAAALALGLREWSEAEYTAVFAQLTRSVRTFSMGKDSRNYVEYLNGTVGRFGR